MGAEHFRELARVHEPVDASRSVARLDGEHLALREWTIAAGPCRETALEEYAEGFVVPRDGSVELLGAGPVVELESGTLAFLPAPAEVRLSGAGCRFSRRRLAAGAAAGAR